MAISFREHVLYIAPDGTVYQLDVPSNVGRWVISNADWGMPPIEYITNRGPFQDGQTVQDFFLQPRTVQLLIRQQFCDRQGYWDGRAALLDAIRPNRQLTPTGVQPGQLCQVLPDGQRRYLDVFIAQGPRFEPRQIGRWDEWAFQEVLRFTAYNPVVYDPATLTITFTTTLELIFPITFPIIFGSINSTAAVTYVGTWLEYPTIVITGPINSPAIINQTTGETIALQYNVSAGEVVTIDLAYGAKTVVSSLAGNLIGTVTPSSDLGTFHLAPDPEAPGGVNTIMATGTGVSGASSIVLHYKHRYIGI